MPYLQIKTKLTLKLLLRNWKENSGCKKKDSVRSVTQITMRLLNLRINEETYGTTWGKPYEKPA